MTDNPLTAEQIEAQRQAIKDARQGVKDDPALRNKVRILEIEGDDLAVKGNYGKAIQAAADELNYSRMLSGERPITMDLIHKEAPVVSTAYTAPVSGSRFYFEDSGAMGVVPILTGKYDIGIAVDVHQIPVTDEFKQRLSAADGGVSILWHELGHAISGPSESRADAFMGEVRAVRGESSMPEKLRTIAEFRDLEVIFNPADTTHNTADVLYREAHDLASVGPDGKNKRIDELHKQLDGKPLSEVAQMAQISYAEPGEKAMKDAQDIGNAIAYAQFATVSDVLHARFGTPLEHIPAERVPEHLGVAGVATLLRVEYALEHATTFGKDNAIAKAMPEMEKKNPEVFAQAREYAKAHWDMDVTASAAPPSTPAVPAQGSDVKAK